MRKSRYRLPEQVVAALFTLFLVVAGQCTALAEPSPDPDIRAYFSPYGGGTEAIVSEIDRAKTEVLVQAYSFTSSPIAKALLEARKRGVVVVVVLDKSHRTATYSAADFLVNSGIATYIDGKHAIAHNKIMIVDSDVVVTGSFNFTKAAEEKNAENVVLIRGKPDLAAKYLANFEWHLRHSEAYAGRGD